ADGEVVWLEGEQLESLRPQDRHSEQGHEDASAESSAVPSDRHHMWRALELARAAGDAGELPVGAVVVVGGRELAAAGNRTEAANDPSAHAEVLALREAARKADDWRLEGATLYVTLEPCAMCFGAVL